MECLIFLYRYNYIPLFSKEIFSWAQKDIDSVEGKAIIDQAYEAIYNGSNSGIGAVIDNSFQTFKYTLQTISLLLILGTISNKLILLIFVLNIAEYYIQAINNTWLTKNKMSENRITSYQNYFTRTLLNRSTGKDIRIFNFKSLIHEYFEKLSKLIINWQTKYAKVKFTTGLLQASINYIGILLALLVLLYNKHLVIEQILLFITTITIINNNFSRIRNVYSEIGRNLVYVNSFQKIFQFAERGTSRHENKLRIENITVNHIGYQINNKQIIEDINLSLKRGQSLIIVGENGAGKSTLIKLLSGLYTPSEGEIEINGMNLNKIDKVDYRKQLAVVFQDDIILHFTIAENIALTTIDKINFEKVNECLQMVDLIDFVNKLPNKEKTFIGNELDNRGIQLSGGQKAKILLARMLYKDADVNILDEPTAAMDSISEALLYELVEEKLSNKINIFISHRLSSEKIKGKIAVMRSGRIVGYGTHDSLLNNCNYYREMWDAQKKLYEVGD